MNGMMDDMVHTHILRTGTQVYGRRETEVATFLSLSLAFPSRPRCGGDGGSCVCLVLDLRATFLDGCLCP